MLDRILCGREIRGVAQVLPPHLDAEGIATDAGLLAPLETVPYSLCDEDASLRFWRAVMARAKDATLPFQLGLALPHGTYDVVDYLTVCAADVRAVFLTLQRVFPLITSDFRWEVDESTCTVALTRSASMGPEQAFVMAQFILGVVFGRLRERVDAPLRYELVTLATEPVPARRYEEAFGQTPRFRAERSEVRFARASFGAPLASANAGLYGVLDRHATLLLERVARAQGPMAKVRAAIQDQLRQGAPSLERVGGAVAMSARTLQRRLHEQGTTFAALVDEERASAARALLGDARLDISEIAYRVGYSEPSAFVRAFRRWADCTPSEFRGLIASKRGAAA